MSNESMTERVSRIAEEIIGQSTGIPQAAARKVVAELGAVGALVSDEVVATIQSSSYDLAARVFEQPLNAETMDTALRLGGRDYIAKVLRGLAEESRNLTD